MISLKTSLRARETTEGNGARVKRLFPHGTDDFHDPFVLLDEFFVSPPAGFPEHPHRGFEAITYMKEGAFRHADNLGNDRTLGVGGVQRFTAGRGLVHAEMPGEAPVNHGFQLWVNLPRRLKGIEPSYQAVEAADIPETRRNGVRVKTLVGPGSPVIVHTDMLYQDIILSSGKRHAVSIPAEFGGMIYVYAGTVSMLELTLGRGEAIEIQGGEEVLLESRRHAWLIVIAGRPHGEPICLNGPFVD